jgi:Na+-driven multidrug efflux pump
MLYNAQLLKYAGENGVAAYGVLMYSGFVFVSAFIGYSIGSAPIVSYNFGAGNREELRNVRRKSLIIIAVFSIAMFAVGEFFAKPFSAIFVGYDEELLKLTAEGFLYYAISFLFCGFGIYSSGFFTALNNGGVSALISVFRTVVFQCICVLVLPLFLGINGIFLSLTVSELLSAAVGGGLLIALRKKYGY